METLIEFINANWKWMGPTLVGALFIGVCWAVKDLFELSASIDSSDDGD